MPWNTYSRTYPGTSIPSATKGLRPPTTAQLYEAPVTEAIMMNDAKAIGTMGTA